MMRIPKMPPLSLQRGGHKRVPQCSDDSPRRADILTCTCADTCASSPSASSSASSLPLPCHGHARISYRSIRLQHHNGDGLTTSHAMRGGILHSNKRPAEQGWSLMAYEICRQPTMRPASVSGCSHLSQLLSSYRDGWTTTMNLNLPIRNQGSGTGLSMMHEAGPC